MSIGSKRRGFSLIEALMAVAVTGLAVTTALAAMRSLARAEGMATKTEVMQRLAFEKYDELVATGEVTSATLEGDFSDRNVEGYAWEAEVEQSGVESLSVITVRVTTTDTRDNLEAQARGLLFEPPPPPVEGGAG